METHLLRGDKSSIPCIVSTICIIFIISIEALISFYMSRNVLY